MQASLLPPLVSVGLMLVLDLFKDSFKSGLKAPKTIAVATVSRYLPALKT